MTYGVSDRGSSQLDLAFYEIVFFCISSRLGVYFARFEDGSSF